MQQFVARSFSNAKSTNAALQLLHHFKSVLQRDNLKADLAKMYKVLLHPTIQIIGLAPAHSHLSCPLLEHQSFHTCRSSLSDMIGMNAGIGWGPCEHITFMRNQGHSSRWPMTMK